jgi:hypothetical protein
MRRRSLTNSRNHENLDLRAEYAESVWYDEIAYLFPGDDTEAVVKLGSDVTYRISRKYEDAADTNHIWSIGSRPDKWSNLVRLSRITHIWFHKHLNMGRVLCLAAKHAKGPPDWNPTELSECAGKSVVGWLETVGGLEPWVEAVRQRLVADIAKSKRKRA